MNSSETKQAGSGWCCPSGRHHLYQTSCLVVFGTVPGSHHGIVTLWWGGVAAAAAAAAFSLMFIGYLALYASSLQLCNTSVFDFTINSACSYYSLLCTKQNMTIPMNQLLHHYERPTSMLSIKLHTPQSQQYSKIKHAHISILRKYHKNLSATLPPKHTPTAQLRYPKGLDRIHDLCTAPPLRRLYKPDRPPATRNPADSRSRVAVLAATWTSTHDHHKALAHDPSRPNPDQPLLHGPT